MTIDIQRAAPLLLTALCASPAAGGPPGTPAGPAWVVNSYTTGDQVLPSVAAAATGAFVVVWESAEQDGYGWGVFGQRHDAAGNATGAEFQVNTVAAGHQAYPRVASSAGGEFLVVWDTFGQDGSSFGVFGQWYEASGQRSGVEFRVNTHTSQSQSNPAAAWSANGSRIAVWQSEHQDGSLFGVFGQVYDAAGAPSGPEFRVNAHTPNNQAYPEVAARADGAFVVVWQDWSRDGGGFGVFGRVFDASGAPVGDDFRVNTFTPGNQVEAVVAWTGASGFVVVWHGGGDGSSLGVFGQRFDAGGTPNGSEFAVNTSTLGAQGLPSVAAEQTGAFMVVWTSTGYEGNGAGIFGRRYDTEGMPEGPEFVVNAYTTGGPAFPVVAASRGGFVVAWQSGEQDGSGDAILAQRFHGDLIFADGFE